MRIKTIKSPLWRLLKLPFPHVDLSNLFLTFGRTIYCSQEITDDLVVHENVHILQQRSSYLYAVIWWFKYIGSVRFRYTQELEAYRMQLGWLRGTIKDKNERYRILRSIAMCLADKRYEFNLTLQEAIDELSK